MLAGSAIVWEVHAQDELETTPAISQGLLSPVLGGVGGYIIGSIFNHWKTIYTSRQIQMKPLCDKCFTGVLQCWPSGEIGLHAGEAAKKPGEIIVNPGQSVVQTGEASVKAGEIALNTGETIVKTGKAATKHGEIVLQTAEATAKTG